MSSLNFDEECARLDAEIAQMNVLKDVAALETTMLDFKKRRAEAYKSLTVFQKNIEELEGRIAQRKSEMHS